MAACRQLLLRACSKNYLGPRTCLAYFGQHASKKGEILTKDNELPPKPKRPKVSYLLFVESIWPRIKQENPESKNKELIKKAAKEWASLDPQVKEDYKKKYQELYNTYLQQLGEYEGNLTDAQKDLRDSLLTNEELNQLKIQHRRRLEMLGKPKRPSTPFLCFMEAKRPMKEKSVNIQAWISNIGKEWRELSDEKKAEFKTHAAELRENYQNSLKEWELKMEEMGRPDITSSKILSKKGNEIQKKK